MRNYLIILGLFIAVIGLAGSIYYEDKLFSISFLWAIVYGMGELFDNNNQ